MDYWKNYWHVRWLAKQAMLAALSARQKVRRVCALSVHPSIRLQSSYAFLALFAVWYLFFILLHTLTHFCILPPAAVHI